MSMFRVKGEFINVSRPTSGVDAVGSGSSAETSNSWAGNFQMGRDKFGSLVIALVRTSEVPSSVSSDPSLLPRSFDVLALADPRAFSSFNFFVLPNGRPGFLLT